MLKTAPKAEAPGTCATVNAFNLSCGQLSGTFQMGTPPEYITGSYSMVLSGTNTININDLNVEINNVNPHDYTGNWTTQENLFSASPGIISATRVSHFETQSNGTISSPYSATYFLDGNPTGILTVPLSVEQSVQDDCSTGNISSTICIDCTIPAVSVPTLSQWSLIILALLLLIIGTVGIRSTSNETQPSYER